MRGRAVAVLTAGAVTTAATLGMLRAAAPPAGAREDAATVLVAASLAPVVAGIDPRGRHSAAGSDRLALQVRAGARADLFVSADPALARALHREGLLSRPVAVARNRLAVIVARAASERVRTVADLGRPGLRVVLAAPSVPAGAYARGALSALGLLGPVRANLVSEEPDVTAVGARVALGAADAGVVYETDARALGDRVRVRAIPDVVQPRIVYAAGIPAAARHPDRGRALLARLAAPEGATALRRAGFLPVES